MEDEQNLLQQNMTEDYYSNRKVALVYSWGRNQDGQLAINSGKNTTLPTAPRGLKGYARQIATARTHTAVINHQGQIYMTGSLLFGKLGINAQVSNFREFHLQNHMTQYKVKQVACGDYHTLALTYDGLVFSWGGSLWDKTGHKSGGIHQIEKLANQQIVEIACGDFHSMALNSKGQVYSWGGGGQNKNKGQLGHSNKKDLPHPQLVQFFKAKPVIKIACGDYHSMVVTKDEQLYAFGQGNFGQLGTGGKEDSATPKKVVLNFSLALEEYFRADITEKTKVSQIALGGHHSLLLTNKGHVYVCGYGSQGQLGLGQGNTDNKYQPTLVKSLLGKEVIMVAAGANHSLALTSHHDVYSCGYNAKGQLGIGQDRSLTIWTHVSHLSGKNVGKIFAGGDHSWAVIDETSPIIENYEPPSPIKLTIEQPTMIKHQQRPQKSVISGNSVDSILGQLNANRKLQLILTQVQLSHRFIHFVVKQSCRNLKKRIDQFLSFVNENQKKQMRHYRVTEDSQMYDSKNKLILPANPRGNTIMLVCQIPSTANQYNYVDATRTQIAIGDLLMMQPNMLKVDGKIPIHNRWFFKFNDMFDDVIERIRFIQLRPKNIQ